MEHTQKVELHRKLVRAYMLHRKIWARACKHDKLDPEGTFVVLSDDNPYTSLLNRTSTIINTIRTSIYGEGLTNG